MSSTRGVDETRYYSYLLRMWQVPANGMLAWRIQLENVQSGEKRGFTSLEELLTCLSNVTTQANETSGEGHQTEEQG